MSVRKRAVHRRIQPYAWLGAGAVTLGMGAAMVGGTAVAFASTGADSADNSSTSASSDAASTKSETRNEAPRQRPARAARAGATADASATPTRRGRVVAAVTDATSEAAAAVAQAAAAAEPVAVNKSGPAAAAATTRTTRSIRDRIAEVAVPSPDPDPVAKDSAPAPAAAVPAAGSDPTPSYPESYLPGAETIGGTNPGNQIIPGQHVQMALEEIAVTQGMIKAATWGSGNFLAGIGSLGPQALLTTAQLSLTIWGATIGGVQDFLSKTSRIPLVKYLGRAAVFNELLVPMVSDISLGVAVKLIPTLGWVGADVAPAEAVASAAQQDGKIYAIVPLRVKAGTEPTVKAKINGGRNATLLVDTGASGLVTTADKIGSAPLGPKTGEGNSCFSGGLCYHYDTYNMTVDLGNGATTTAPVNVVTDNAEYPDSVSNFKEFFNWGADGIIGIGANTEGPGPAPIPTAAMPGELSDGVLVFQNALPLGLGGVMILGPNPLPTRVSVPGAPDAFVKVSVNGGAKQDGAAIIDSGGVYGTLNQSFMPGETSVDVPAGTKIDVYNADGSALLYSYTTKGGNRTTQFIDAGLFNTGNAPFAQGPVYLNYGFDQPYGQGSTDFSIW